MENDLQITPEKLAYLNENLDLVNEYTEIHWRDVYDQFQGQGDPIVRITYGLSTTQSPPRYITYIILVGNHGWVAGNWEPLLEYVENTSNTPSILK